MSEAEKRQIDWERIEADYRAGLLSLREIAAANPGVSHVSISKHAKRDGWIRDLSAKINAKAEAKPPVSIDALDKSGYVYLIYVDAPERFYKIGMSSNFGERFFAHQCSSPYAICIACAFFVPNMRYMERSLHARYADRRVRGEWFSLSIEDVKEIAAMACLVD